MRIIGTAGHVDHGKSTLIAALTGTHPDRLKEEQEREMTIELGFGWMVLPDGQEAGIIDVPGHRDFIENMLSGIGGIDVALLVIAADEGVMPQTSEHLAILDLLQIEHGILVLTKVDLIEDLEWLTMVENDIRSAVKGTIMAEAPIIRVSARKGIGLEELKKQISVISKDVQPRLDLARPRLPIDRVFSMPGFGTVVTGTLLDGHLSIGDEIEVLPSGKKGRIRGLQTHKKKEEISTAGSRTAANISGLAVGDINRGDILVTPGHYQETRRVDVLLKLVKQLSLPLKNGSEVKIFSGTSESMAAARILESDTLESGQEGWVQLDLKDPMILVRGDRFILRRPSPGETIGGGKITDPSPKHRHKRYDEKNIQRLRSLADGSPGDILFQAALISGPVISKDLILKSHLDSDLAEAALQECFQNKLLLNLDQPVQDFSAGIIPVSAREDDLLIAAPHWIELEKTILSAVSAFHVKYPLRRGIPREELKSRLKLNTRIFNSTARHINIRDGGSWLALPNHSIEFSNSQKELAANLLKKFSLSPYNPPSIRECLAEIGDDIFNALLETSELVQVSPEIVFKKADYDQLIAEISFLMTKNDRCTAAEVRDELGTSRKYALAILEHMDNLGITIRDGDYRRLKNK
ncbi:MAG: selenocysteine-specific translation elongation factor [Chloroflexota bacterium]